MAEQGKSKEFWSFRWHLSLSRVTLYQFPQNIETQVWNGNMSVAMAALKFASLWVGCLFAPFHVWGQSDTSRDCACTHSDSLILPGVPSKFIVLCYGILFKIKFIWEIMGFVKILHRFLLPFIDFLNWFPRFYIKTKWRRWMGSLRGWGVHKMTFWMCLMYLFRYICKESCDLV